MAHRRANTDGGGHDRTLDVAQTQRQQRCQQRTRGAALQFTYANINGFSENGSLAPMQIQSDSVSSLRRDVGFRLFHQWQVGKVIIEPSLKAAWEDEYLYSALPVTAGFANFPGPMATFTGPAEGHDSVIVSAGVSVQWTPT